MPTNRSIETYFGDELRVRLRRRDGQHGDGQAGVGRRSARSSSAPTAWWRRSARRSTTRSWPSRRSSTSPKATSSCSRATRTWAATTSSEGRLGSRPARAARGDGRLSQSEVRAAHRLPAGPVCPGVEAVGRGDRIVPDDRQAVPRPHAGRRRPVQAGAVLRGGGRFRPGAGGLRHAGRHVSARAR